VEPGTPVEIGIFGGWQPAIVCDEPLFDPTNARVRA
jgi:hypothetical protein